MRVEKKTETREKDVEREGRLCLKCFRGSFLLAPISEIRGLVLFSVFLVSCFMWFSPDAQASAGFERYEIILTRSPFGKEPPPEEVSAPVRPNGEFAKQYRLSMLYEDAQGQLKAGLVSKVNNKSLLLQVGESGEGVRLVDVLLEEGVAVLSSGDQMARLLLEGLGSSAALSPGLFAGAHQKTDVDPTAFEARQTTRGALLLPKPDDRTVLIGRPRVALKKKTTMEVSAGRKAAEASSGGSPVDGVSSSPDDGLEPVQVADREEQRKKILSRPFSFQQVAGWQAERLGLKQ